MRFKQSLLEKLLLAWFFLVSIISGGVDPVTVQSLEKMGIEVWENEYEGGKGSYTIFVWPLKVDEKMAGSAIAEFAKTKKVVSFYGGENCVLKSAFFQSLGVLPDVERLLLSRCEEAGAFAEMANAFPNATSIDLSDVGIFGKLPVFPKAKKFSTDAVFDDSGLSFLAKMPEVKDDFILAENS